VPLIFGTGTLTSDAARRHSRQFHQHARPTATRSWTPAAATTFPRLPQAHGYDHLVLYGRHAQWTLLKIDAERRHLPRRHALPSAWTTSTFGAAIERDFDCTERQDMAMARITSAGENQVLCSGIMGGPKAIWARGGGGAKMGSLHLKAIVRARQAAGRSRCPRTSSSAARRSARRSCPPA
jgi:aldehyde:ferredoxin oxidoreductase